MIGKSHTSIIDIGDTIMCVFCNADYSENNESGGGLVGDYAVCPDCLEKVYLDGHMPDLVCPKGVTFKEFVLRIRDSRNFIAIQTFDN